jgi:O-antigen ligase
VGAWPGFSPGPFTGLLLACAAAFVISRLIASVGRTLVPAAVVAGAAILSLTTPDVLSGANLGGPLGYANANGAFFLQAATAGMMLAAASRVTSLRILGLAATIAFGVVPFAAKSVTAAALLLILPVVALSARSMAGPRVAVASVSALFIVALAATIVLGSTYNSGGRSSLVDRIVDASIDERRAVLWQEALVMMRRRPATGVGLGGFQVFSATARADRDARWAHNSFLQHGAETGLIGLILLTLLFVWGFASLGTTGKPDSVIVLGAVALAGLGIHACVDYILHFPAVPITAAALVGAATLPR